MNGEKRNNNLFITSRLHYSNFELKEATKKMAEIKTTIKGELTISPDAFNTLVKLKEGLEDLIGTIEIMNDKELMEGLKRSK